MVQFSPSFGRQVNWGDLILPFPTRIPLFYAIVFAVALMVVQLLEGTSGAFAMLHFAFVIISVLAFNIADGMSSASGWYIFFLSTLSVLVGTIAKAVMGEPADATSAAPLLTMAAFTVGAAGVLLAVSASRNLTKTIPSIAVRLGARELNYMDASIGCTVMGLVIEGLRAIFPAGPGTIMSALIQLDIFFQLAILLGTIAVVQATRGRRSVGVVNLVPSLIAFSLSVVTFTKQGMLTPFVCWLIGVIYVRFRLKLIHFLFCAAFVYLTMTVLYPLAQVGRNLITDDATMSDRFNAVKDMVTHLDNTQAIMETSDMNLREGADRNYFLHDVGFLERFTRWPADDQLIDFTSHGHYIGYRVITDAFLNWFPHALLPNKDASQAGFSGNYYLHEMGGLSDDDTSTGISFSPIAEAFHMDGWLSLTTVAPLIWFLLFLSVDLLCGDIRESPWGLFFALSFAHIAPEGALAGVVAFIWHGNVALFIGMLFCINAAPFVGALLTGASRRSRLLQTGSIPLPAE